jgi:uncharacterized protein (DUF2249 family)
MIKFFRKIRQKLLSENNFGKYLLYALGEILLVVIGILIALEVNNWNESKKISRQEIALIENLRSEFKVNLENLEEVKAQNQIIYNSTNELKNLIGQETSIINEHNVDSLLLKAILITDYQPNQFVLSQLKTGERLDIINSEKLKKLLYEWDKALNAKTEAFNMLNTYFMNSLITFLDENTSIRNVDLYGKYEWSHKTPLKYNSTNMFHMIEFDNRLENHIWCVNSFGNSIDTLITIAKKIEEEITKG